MIDLYIYYRVRETDADRLQACLRTVQAALGVAGQLKRRPGSKDGLQTWMEVYTGVGPEFEAVLNAALAAANAGQWIEGDRHTEVFMDLTPCA